MITAYTGTPGSGKTLAAIKDLVKWRGVQTITNIDLQGISYTPLPDDVELLTQMCIDVCQRQENQTLIVIDEAQMLFNCREWSNAGRSGWLKFFTHHRKYGARIILVTQSLSYLDKQIRQLIEYEYRFRRLSRWGWVGYLLYLITIGEKYLYIEYYVPANERLGLHINMLGRKYFKYYDTFEIPNNSQIAEYGAGGSAMPSGAILTTGELPRSSKIRSNPLLLDYILTTRFFKGGKHVLQQAKTLWQLFINKVKNFAINSKIRITESGIIETDKEKRETEFWNEKFSQCAPGQGQFDFDYIVEPVELD